MNLFFNENYSINIPVQISTAYIIGTLRKILCGLEQNIQRMIAPIIVRFTTGFIAFPEAFCAGRGPGGDSYYVIVLHNLPPTQDG
jgi:hypothetical protein